jgi:hypothetical protein
MRSTVMPEQVERDPVEQLREWLVGNWDPELTVE